MLVSSIISYTSFCIYIAGPIHAVYYAYSQGYHLCTYIFLVFYVATLCMTLLSITKMCTCPMCRLEGRFHTIVPSALPHVGRGMLHTIVPSVKKSLRQKKKSIARFEPWTPSGSHGRYFNQYGISGIEVIE